MRNISQETINLIIDLYKSGKTTYEIADTIKCSQSFILNTLKRNNIERRSTYSYIRKYNVNENFFDKIDTEAKAYFLGLMFADGNNYRSEKNDNGHDYQINITLQEQDKDILEIYKSYIVPNIDLKFIKSKDSHHKNQYRLRFDSKIVSDQLVKLGCVPNKSMILEYPTCIPDNLQHHFLRGYFDGDGSISFWIKQWKTTTNKNYTWQITSTKNFCEGAKQIIEYFAKITPYQRATHPKLNQITTTISLGGNQQVYRLMSWLYQDATIFLKRKHNKYLELKSLIENT